MTVSIRAKTNTYAKYTLVEISPQRILYQIHFLDGSYQKYSLPLPLTYASIRGVGLYRGDGVPRYRPSYLLGANKAVFRKDLRVCPLPLVGLTSGGAMCQGSMRIPWIDNPTEAILAAVTAGLASSGLASTGYIYDLIDNPAFIQLANATGIPIAYEEPLTSKQNKVKKIYEYWESLDEFPADIDLSVKSIEHWGFTKDNFVRRQVLVK